MFMVIEYTPGYLPESDDPPEFEELDNAVEYVNDRVDEYLETEGTDYRIMDKLVGADSGRNIAYEVRVANFNTVADDLGRRIEVVRAPGSGSRKGRKSE